MKRCFHPDDSPRGSAQACLLAFLGAPLLAAPAIVQSPCAVSAQQMLSACREDATASFWLQRAQCTNLADAAAQLDCTLDAWDGLLGASGECDARYGSRLSVCARLGGVVHDPVIDPEHFVELVDNPHFPLIPGTTMVFEKQTGDGLERVEIHVTHDTREILGVECTVVESLDIVFEAGAGPDEGELEEHTFDWYAQDVHGNVWYFGELSMDFEDGDLVGLGGSFEAGKDGAKPGILMPADPVVGSFYRQEFLLGEAEDVAGVLRRNARASVPYGSFVGCLQTEDFTALEPDALEHKFYAPGVGLVLEVDLADGQRTELVSVTRE